MTTILTVSACPRCGTIAKSGKMSCCGRGGSWFKNCGGTGKMKLHHTWYEGIQACKTPSQSKTVIGNQLNGAHQEDTDSSESTNMDHYKRVIAATRTFAFTPKSHMPARVSITTTPALMLMTNMSNTLMTYSIHTTSASKVTVTQGCVCGLTNTVYLFVIVSSLI